MNIKTLKLLELTGTTLKAISADAGITRATLYNNLRDDAVPTLRFALKLENVTGINHQFFLYQAPICMQFAHKVK